VGDVTYGSADLDRQGSSNDTASQFLGPNENKNLL